MVVQNKKILRPTENRVLLQRLSAEEKKGGIILPDSAQTKQEKAKVLAIGPGKLDKNGKKIPLQVAKDDIVLIDKYAGQEVTLNDEEFIILRDSDIIAIVEE